MDLDTRQLAMRAAWYITQGIDPSPGNGAFWAKLGNPPESERNTIASIGNALVAGAENYASVDANRYTLRGVFDPQFQGAGSIGGPLGTAQATVSMKVEIIKPGGGSAFRTVQVNLAWDDTVAEANQLVTESATVIQDSLGGIEYLLRLETIRIY